MINNIVKVDGDDSLYMVTRRNKVADFTQGRYVNLLDLTRVGGGGLWDVDESKVSVVISDHWLQSNRVK